MRNRAKCKLCNSIIESFHQFDYVSCKCEEISISGGGSSLEVFAKNYDNFLRVDDEGNTIIVSVKKADEIAEANHAPVTKTSLVEMLDEMIKNIQNLPRHAMDAPITHADFCSLLMLLSSIFKSTSTI